MNDEQIKNWNEILEHLEKAKEQLIEIAVMMGVTKQTLDDIEKKFKEM